MSKNIATVATSLGKQNISKQYQAVESWKSAGFTVISVNASDDVDILGPHFPGVAFVIDKDARPDQDGNYYVQLTMLIHALHLSNGDICGISKPDAPFVNNSVPLVDPKTAGSMLHGANSGIGFADHLIHQIQQCGVCFFYRKDALFCQSDIAIFFRC